MYTCRPAIRRLIHPPLPPSRSHPQQKKKIKKIWAVGRPPRPWRSRPAALMSRGCGVVEMSWMGHRLLCFLNERQHGYQQGGRSSATILGPISSPTVTTPKDEEAQCPKGLPAYLRSGILPLTGLADKYPFDTSWHDSVARERRGPKPYIIMCEFGRHRHTLHLLFAP